MNAAPITNICHRCGEPALCASAPATEVEQQSCPEACHVPEPTPDADSVWESDWDSEWQSDWESESESGSAWESDWQSDHASRCESESESSSESGSESDQPTWYQRSMRSMLAQRIRQLVRSRRSPPVQPSAPPSAAWSCNATTYSSRFDATEPEAAVASDSQASESQTWPYGIVPYKPNHGFMTLLLALIFAISFVVFVISTLRTILLEPSVLLKIPVVAALPTAGVWWLQNNLEDWPNRIIGTRGTSVFWEVKQVFGRFWPSSWFNRNTLHVYHHNATGDIVAWEYHYPVVVHN